MNRATRVLLVDDEESVRTFVERTLHLAGYETAAATDGAEALKIAEDQGPFDLLLADVVMPGMHGDELARLLRRIDPDLKVLYLTGYSDRLFKSKATLWENEAFLDKPCTANALLEAVSLMLFGHTHQGGRGPLAEMAHSRSLRVATGPFQVRLGGAVGRLVNISATGALVHVQQALAPEREWPMLINGEPEPVELRVRVVRSHAVSIPLPGATWRRQEYAVALRFTDLPPMAKEALKTLCGDGFSRQE